MTAVTHYAFSYLVCSAMGCDHTTALTASTFSLLPDIDHPQSLIGRLFPGVSKYILRKYGHRSVTHSVFAILALCVLLLPVLLFSGMFYAASVFAFSSHIFIDLFNRSGVRLFSPISQKEYISFRTLELRVPVSSWQEYLVLFVIVFFAFSVSGQAFSLTRAVRSASKVLYKTYDIAVSDYKDNSGSLCVARIEYFDHLQRRMVTDTMDVLHLFASKAFLVKDDVRYIILKQDIDEIDIEATEGKVKSTKIEGTGVSLLEGIPSTQFIAGSITVHNYDPDIKSSDVLKVKRYTDHTVLELNYCKPYEVRELMLLDEKVQDAIHKLQRELTTYRIAELQREESAIRGKLRSLNRSGIYSHYTTATQLSSELSSIQSSIAR